MYLDVICHIFGHRWDYYGNKRTCKRCNVEEEYHKVEITQLGDGMYKIVDIESKIDTMYISRNFTMEEMVHTDTGLPNEPGQREKQALTDLVNNVLQPARNILNMQIKINSGYRSPAVNTKVKGSKTSRHMKGEAADLDCADNAKLFNIIRDIIKNYDQLIWEKGDKNQPDWVHVSWCHNNRKQIIYNY
jgi:zinc D-Ala-D-Ala carboxypeptidase